MKNKEYNLVTLEELEALYEKADGLRKDLPMKLSSGHTLLEKHLIAERLMQRNYKEVEWLNICKSLADICGYAYLWAHPLAWRDPSLYPDFVIDGRVAKEVFDDTRYPDIIEVVDYIYDQIVLDYADNPIVANEDALEAGLAKGMHEWSTLTWGLRSSLDDGEFIKESWDSNGVYIKDYDFICLRHNLTVIAEQRSPKRAAELLRMLQDEWPQIKKWKTGLETMKEEDIEDFEYGLFNKFDDLLAAGENDNTAPEPDSSFFDLTGKMTYDICRKELIRCINDAKSKAKACREIMRSATAGYFALSDKTDDEKAIAINPWVPLTNKNYVFNGDDFCKARNNKPKGAKQ